MMLDFKEWMKVHQARVQSVAERLLPSENLVPIALHQAMRYAVIGGGKRVRPLLVYAASEITDGCEDVVDFTALAVECVHSYSLIHDDLPCMDNDTLRHGKPTTHIKFGEATAMLAGDALQPEAVLLLLRSGLPAEQCMELVRLLAEASSTTGMCGGQAIDLSVVGQSVSYEELQKMHAMKTGALLKTSVLMGAMSGQPKFISSDLLENLKEYGEAIGLAFQIVDDILDVTEDTATLGKTAGKDEKNDKPTYVSLFGLDRSRQLVVEQHNRALDALCALGPLQSKSKHLADIADYIIKRSY